MNVKALLKKYTMVIALVVVFIFFTILTGGRLTNAQNVSNLLLQNAYVLVMACGMLLCILTGGNVDLSIGASLCLCGALAAKMMQSGAPAGFAILAALTVAAVIGVWQGYLIGFVHIPPFICTLAGMFLWRGLARVVLDSRTISIQNSKFLDLFSSYIQIPGIDENKHCVSALIVGIIVAVVITLATLANRARQAKNGYDTGSKTGAIVKLVIIDLLIVIYSYKLMQYKGIPVMLIWILAVVLIFAFVTSSTVFGRYFYAVGGNEKAAKLSGVNTQLVYLLAYANIGLLAGFAGTLTLARAGHAEPTYGQGYEMDAIAACFIGGASAYGGVGKITGVIIGAALMGVINQGMSIMGISANYQSAVKGAVLLIAVLVDVLSKRENV